MAAPDDTERGPLCGNPGGESELLDAYVVELDPVVDGFTGVLVELYALGSGAQGYYEVRQSALASGNRLLLFSTGEEGLARVIFEAGAGGFTSRGTGAVG